MKQNNPHDYAKELTRAGVNFTAFVELHCDSSENGAKRNDPRSWLWWGLRLSRNRIKYLIILSDGISNLIAELQLIQRNVEAEIAGCLGERSKLGLK